MDAAAESLLRAIDTGRGTAFSGIRFKSFEAPTRQRGLRTFARFVAAVTRDGRLPDGFVVTFPKVTSVEQVEAMVVACEQIEAGVGLAAGAIRFEIQVETPQAICGPDGTALVARMVHASAGRCTSLHYGTYDYSASCGIAAAYQSMEHPAADHAKAVMQVAAAGTGVHLSDGSTNILPVGNRDAGPRRLAAARPAGAALARARLLPGLGPAPGPAAQPVPRHLRLLPRGPRPAWPATQELCGTSGFGRHGRTRHCPRAV